MRSTIHLMRRASVVATIASGLLVAGCGGSAGDKASAGTSAPTRTSTSVSSSGTGSRSAVHAGSVPAPLRFSECMRANGVSNFPDPTPGGEFSVPSGDDPQSPVFRTAQAKCQPILHAGGSLPSFGGRTDAHLALAAAVNLSVIYVTTGNAATWRALRIRRGSSAVSTYRLRRR